MESKTVSINIEIAIFNAFPSLTYFTAVYDLGMDAFICLYSFALKEGEQKVEIQGKFIAASYCDIYIAVKNAKEKPV